MRICEKCGATIGDDDRFCVRCGTPVKADAARPVQAATAGSSTVQEIGNWVADYYNQTFKTESSNGKYVVLHQETTVSGNICKVIVRYQTGTEANGTFACHRFADVTVNMTTGEMFSQSSTPKPVKRRGRVNYVSLSLLICCLLAWCVFPFAAINILTLGDQPTALEIIRNDVIYIGDLSKAPQAWAAILSLIGIIACLISTLAKAPRGTRVFALLTELPMAWALVKLFRWADSMGGLEEVFGFGFWAVLILLAIVIFASKRKE